MTKDTPEKDAPLELDYSLIDLASSQHRAGLAGLVMVTRWLARQPVKRGICELTRLDDAGATLRLDFEGLQGLLDDVYGADVGEEEERSTAKRAGKAPLRKEVTPTASGKAKTEYIYPPRVLPRGSFLADLDPKGPWIKLWQDIVWTICCDSARYPYKKRAMHETVTSDAADLWRALKHNSLVDLASTCLLGAQDKTAERVSFRDQAHTQFLLRFWLFTVQVYCLYKYKKEGREADGYAIAVPDVCNLRDFCDELEALLRARSREKIAFRPRDAIIDLPAEGGLDMLRQLRARMVTCAGDQSIEDLVLGIDVIHIDRLKTTRPMCVRSVIHIDPLPSMVDAYTLVRRQYKAPLFRHQRLLNLMQGRPWYCSFGELMAVAPLKHLTAVDHEGVWFQNDCQKAFKEEVMDVDDTNLERLLYNVIGEYLADKTPAELRVSWKVAKTLPQEKYDAAREKVARTALLNVRSRRNPPAFVEYFSGTLCAVSHSMPEEDYHIVARALLTDTRKVRTLTMLALSARS